MQLAGGITEPRQNQNLGHQRPGNFFLAGCERAFDKIHEPHAPAQLQTQPGTPERPLPFHGDALQIDFHPLWLDISEQTALSDGCRSRGLLVKPESSRRIHLTEIGHYALTWTARGTITLDQSPITMALAILLPIAATQVHDSILRIATVFAIGLVFTTRAFKRITSHTTIRSRCKQECYGIPRPKLRKECVQKIFTRCKAAEDELVGETREWETVEYAADAATEGKRKGLMVLGHVPSEQAGMEECTRWLKTFVKDVPTEFVATRQPFWTPTERRGRR